MKAVKQVDGFFACPHTNGCLNVKRNVFHNAVSSLAGH